MFTSPRASLLSALAGRIGILVTIIIITVGAMAYWSANDQIDAVYDSQLIAGANILRALMQEELDEANVGPNLDFQKSLLSPEDLHAFEAFADWRMFRIWRGNKLMMGSDTGPDGLTAQLPAGFRDIEGKSQSWRVFTSVHPELKLTIAVGERLDVRGEIIRRVAFELLLPLLILIPACGALLWLSLSDGLGAVRKLVSAVGGKSERELSPLNVGAWPRDLEPLVTSINRLLDRLRAAFDQSRMFTDLAAHQLRTPLAALKLQAQLAVREHDSAERQTLVESMRDGVDRAGRLVEQLLTLARLDSGPSASGNCDLQEILKSALEELAPLATHAQVDLALSSDGPAVVVGDPALIHLIFSNLLDNALKFSPAGAEIHVAVARIPAAWRITVTDQGPGIAEPDHERVFDRFYRGTQGVPGSGLGLAIVKEALKAMNGTIALTNNMEKRGLAAIVELPAP